MTSDPLETKLCPVTIQWMAKDPGPCARCEREVGEGPVGFTMEEPAGPLCDGCLLALNKDLGMMMWMAHVVRELAPDPAIEDVEDVDDLFHADKCMVIMMTMAKLYHQGATWPHRGAAAIDFVEELRQRLARVPIAEFFRSFMTPPS